MRSGLNTLFAKVMAITVCIYYLREEVTGFKVHNVYMYICYVWKNKITHVSILILVRPLCLEE
jgi:hypothetical protein